MHSHKNGTAAHGFGTAAAGGRVGVEVPRLRLYVWLFTWFFSLGGATAASSSTSSIQNCVTNKASKLGFPLRGKGTAVFQIICDFLDIYDMRVEFRNGRYFVPAVYKPVELRFRSKG